MPKQPANSWGENKAQEEARACRWLMQDMLLIGFCAGTLFWSIIAKLGGLHG